VYSYYKVIALDFEKIFSVNLNFMEYVKRSRFRFYRIRRSQYPYIIVKRWYPKKVHISKIRKAIYTSQTRFVFAHRKPLLRLSKFRYNFTINI